MIRTLSYLLRLTTCALICASLFVTACAVAPQQPASVRADVQTRFDQAQLCMELNAITPADEVQDPECGERLLAEVRAMPDLSVREIAALENMYVFLSTLQGDTAESIRAYEAILALPRDQIRALQVERAMRGLISIYQGQHHYAEALETLDQMQALSGYSGSDQDYYLRAILLYRLEDYPGAIAQTQRALAITDRGHESLYELLYVLQTTSNDRAGAAVTLTELETRWPRPERATAGGALTLAQSGIGEFYRGGFIRVSGAYLPEITPEPVYPPRALARRYEGYVNVRYTVTSTGETRDVMVVESSSPLFDRAAIESVKRYRYEPRIVSNTAVEVEDVTARIEFAMSEEG